MKNFKFPLAQKSPLNVAKSPPGNQPLLSPPLNPPPISAFSKNQNIFKKVRDSPPHLRIYSVTDIIIYILHSNVHKGAAHEDKRIQFCGGVIPQK